MALEKGIELGPGDGNTAEFYGMVTTFLYAIGYPRRALPYARKAAESGDYRSLGRILHALGDYKEALEAYKKALEVGFKPNDIMSLYVYEDRSSLYYSMGMHAAAVEDGDKSIVLQPARSYSYKGRARAYFYLQNYPAALADVA